MRLPQLTLFSAALLLSAAAAQAQDVRKNIEQQRQDPRTAETAAKADVYLLRHKILPDSSQAPTVPEKRKKKKCGNRSKP